MKVIKTNGMDFAETRALWLDEKRLVAPLETTSEERYIMVARCGKCWIAIYTYGNDRLRIIFVRRSRDKERQRYEDDQC